jgi:hypothetical protein
VLHLHLQHLHLQHLQQQLHLHLQQRGPRWHGWQRWAAPGRRHPPRPAHLHV